MTAAVVSISPDDLDAAEGCAATKALSNLAAIHQLPRLQHVYLVNRPDDGRQIVNVAVPAAVAEVWRAALGAPAFSARTLPTYAAHSTEVFWFGATIRLSYSTAA